MNEASNLGMVRVEKKKEKSNGQNEKLHLIINLLFMSRPNTLPLGTRM